MTTRSRAAALLSAAFFASGAGSLAFEALWFHQTGLAFGHGVLASALVLSGFMAGMATGNALSARFGDRLVRPLRAYALLELCVAASGVSLVFAMPWLSRTLAPLSVALEEQPFLLSAIRLGSAWLLLLLPSVAMGMTLPVAVRGLSAWDARFGRVLGLLYGVNTLGAVCGVLLAELVLIGPLGIHGSAFVAAGLCLLAALLGRLTPVPDTNAQPLFASTDADAAVGPADGASPGAFYGKAWPFTLAAGMSGFAMLGLEVVWLRFLLLFVTETPTAFAAVLALVLLGIALGGLLGAWWSARAPGVHAAADLVAYAAAAVGLLGLRVYPEVLVRAFRFEQGVDVVASLAAPLVFAPALLSGLLLTWLGAGLRERAPGDARVSGRLVFANTVGAALGSALAGLWLLPGFGMEVGLVGLLAVLALVGVLLTVTQRRLHVSRGLGLAVASGLVLAYPWGSVESQYVRPSVSRWMSKDDQIVAIREDVTGTLIHVRHGFAGLPVFDQLATNSYSMAVNDFAARRYMKLYAYLPLALHPGMESALVVGFGVGNTVSALTATPELSRIDVVDISRGTLELSRGMDFRGRPHPLSDPRVVVHIEDGRHHLQGTPRRYDLITGEPPPPILAGVSSLYSQEYFELLHDRLNPGGFVSYWLPMMNISAGTGRSIIRAFCAAFEDCSLWHGESRNFMLLGSREGGTGPVPLARYAKRFGDPQERRELQQLGFEHPAQFGTLFIGGSDYLRGLTADDPPVSDVYPRRMHRPGGQRDKDALITAFRDIPAAAERFAASTWVRSRFPERVRTDALRGFEHQRLLNDLLFPGRTNARSPVVLLQVLQHTPFVLPVLLLMNSDPDLQAALAAASPAELEDERLLIHRAAGLLARREMAPALDLLRHTPKALLPMPGLVSALEQLVR